MKILILYTYNKGLFSQFFQEVSERLNLDEFEVFNFFLKHKTSYYEQNGVKIYGEKGEGFFTNYHHIYKIIKKIRPDVVISNFSYINPAILFGRLLGVSHNVSWFHNAFGHTKPNLLKIKNKTFYLNKADLLIANSKQLQMVMHTIYKVLKNRICSIPFWTNIHNNHSNSKSFGSFYFIDAKKFFIYNFSFDPHSVQELINKLHPYLNKKGLTSDYFEVIYNKTFNKDIIYNKVKSVILNQI